MYASTSYTLLSKMLPSLGGGEGENCCDKKKPEQTKKGSLDDAVFQM